MQLENLTVRAPIKGQLTSLNAEIGQSISPGQNLGQIDNIDAYRIRATADEFYIARVDKGLEGEFEYDRQIHRLYIDKVFPEVQGGRFEMDLLFVNEQPNGLRRGQTVRIKLELSAATEAITLDRGGFYQSTGGQWAFVVDESGKFAVRKNISLGRQNSQVFEVLEGLIPGDKVITSSYDNYQDIDKLLIN